MYSTHLTTSHILYVFSRAHSLNPDILSSSFMASLKKSAICRKAPPFFTQIVQMLRLFFGKSSSSLTVCAADTRGQLIIEISHSVISKGIIKLTVWNCSQGNGVSLFIPFSAQALIRERSKKFSMKYGRDAVNFFRNNYRIQFRQFNCYARAISSEFREACCAFCELESRFRKRMIWRRFNRVPKGL